MRRNETRTSDEAAYWSAPREHSSPRVMPDVHIALPDVALPNAAEPDAVVSDAMVPNVAMPDVHIMQPAEEARVASPEDYTKEKLDDILKIVVQQEAGMQRMYMLVLTALCHDDLRKNENCGNTELIPGVTRTTGGNVNSENHE